MRLYFLRHGQSGNNALEGTNGYLNDRVSEPDLTDLGLMQADRTAQFIAGTPSNAAATAPPAVPENPYGDDGFDITHIYSSPHLRALRTAAPVADALGLSIDVHEAIHEAGGVFRFDKTRGVLTGDSGLSRAKALEVHSGIRYPEVLSAQGWWDYRPFETEEERLVRAGGVVEFFARKHDRDDRILIVSHCHFYVYFCCALLGLPYRDGYWFTLNNCAISRFGFGREGIQVEYLNRQEHLAPDLLS